MKIIANNLWERDQMRKLTTPELVQQQIERCEQGVKAAPSIAKVNEWRRKLSFLNRLKFELRKGGTR